MATAAEGRIARVAEAEAVEVLGLITIDHNRANRAPTSPLTQVKLELNVLEDTVPDTTLFSVLIDCWPQVDL